MPMNQHQRVAVPGQFLRFSMLSARPTNSALLTDA